MNRKLRHHSKTFLPALALVGAVLALGALTAASRPVAGNGEHALARAAVLGAEVAAASALATALAPAASAAEAAESTSSRPAGETPRRRRQSLLMPYFSFASRD